MALFHFHVTQIKRSAGQSAIAAAAYRAGEKLHSDYYGEDADYTRKGGVVLSEILLPSHVPPEYADRETLWNAVEKAERGKKAQLAYSFDIALQNEFSMEGKYRAGKAIFVGRICEPGHDRGLYDPPAGDGRNREPAFPCSMPHPPHGAGRHLG